MFELKSASIWIITKATWWDRQSPLSPCANLNFHKLVDVSLQSMIIICAVHDIGMFVRQLTFGMDALLRDSLLILDIAIGARYVSPPSPWAHTHRTKEESICHRLRAKKFRKIHFVAFKVEHVKINLPKIQAQTRRFVNLREDLVIKIIQFCHLFHIFHSILLVLYQIYSTLVKDLYRTIFSRFQHNRLKTRGWKGNFERKMKTPVKWNFRHEWTSKYEIVFRLVLKNDNKCNAFGFLWGFLAQIVQCRND